MNSACLGLLLTTLAGLATTLGSLGVFFIDQNESLRFAMCMSSSSGVMVYIALIELFPTSRAHFIEHFQLTHPLKKSHSLAYLMVTISFFLGWFFTSMLDRCIYYCTNYFDNKNEKQCFKQQHCFTEKNNQKNQFILKQESTSSIEQIQESSPPSCNEDYCYITYKNVMNHRGGGQSRKSTLELQPCFNGIQDYLAKSSPCSYQQENLQHKNNSKSSYGDNAAVSTSPTTILEEQKLDLKKKKKEKKKHEVKSVVDTMFFFRFNTSESDKEAVAYSEQKFKKEQHHFLKVGLVTTIALVIHNFPEGIATFIGTLENSNFGIGIAIAIGLHNIPEGFVISVPIYYGTGNKYKAIFYSLIAGLAEPLGALIAYGLLQQHTNHVMFGWVVGIVCGIMANIGLKQLYPEALKYDPTDKAVSLCFVASMAMIAITLVILEFSEASSSSK